MFKKKIEVSYKQFAPGVELSTLVHGQKTSLVEFKLKAGTVIPEHQHPYEQTGYLVSGAVIFKIQDQSYTAMQGDSWCVPENVPHSAEILEDSIIVEVFSPPRKDYFGWVRQGNWRSMNLNLLLGEKAFCGLEWILGPGPGIGMGKIQ
jgi:quercetin dioxygenase-like cupin family protein